LATCEEVDAIIDLILVECIFEKVVSFEVFVIIGEDHGVLEADCCRRIRVVVDYLAHWLRQDEIEVDVVFGYKVRVDFMC
jgi:hypothetical protein